MSDSPTLAELRQQRLEADVSQLRAQLRDLHGLSECILLAVRRLRLGLDWEFDFEYVWDDENRIRRDLDRWSHGVVVQCTGVVAASFTNDWNAEAFEGPARDGYDWGLEEIERVEVRCDTGSRERAEVDCVAEMVVHAALNRRIVVRCHAIALSRLDRIEVDPHRWEGFRATRLGTSTRPPGRATVGPRAADVAPDEPGAVATRAERSDSLLGFLKTGSVLGIAVGGARATVFANLGAPTDSGATSRRQRAPLVLRHTILETGFAPTGTVTYVSIVAREIPPEMHAIRVGEHCMLDTAGVTSASDIEDVESALVARGIGFERISDDGDTRLRTEGRVEITFVRRPDGREAVDKMITA